MCTLDVYIRDQQFATTNKCPHRLLEQLVLATDSELRCHNCCIAAKEAVDVLLSEAGLLSYTEIIALTAPVEKFRPLIAKLDIKILLGYFLLRGRTFFVMATKASRCFAEEELVKRGDNNQQDVVFNDNG